jgi:hypothetical protein
MMNPATGLALGRVGIGALALASPDLTGKLFRLDAAANPQLPYLSRLFGSREIALGALTLLARGKARRNLVLLGMSVDGADAVAGYLAGRDGYVDQGSSAYLTAPAVLAVLAGAAGLRR